MADGQRIDGISVGAILIGAGLVYAGIKGKSVPSLIQGFVQGQSPATAAAANQLGSTGTSGSAPPLGSVTPSSASQQSWAVAMSLALGDLPTPANTASWVAWSNRESPWNTSPPDGAEYTHNPLNTTESKGEVGTVNSVGVAIYPSWAAGIAATVETLQGGQYGDILAAFKSGKGLQGTFAGLSTWSGGAYSSV